MVFRDKHKLPAVEFNPGILCTAFRHVATPLDHCNTVKEERGATEQLQLSYHRMTSISPSASYSEDTYLQVPIIYPVRFNPLPTKVKMNHLSLQ